MGDYTVKKIDVHTHKLLLTLGTRGVAGSSLAPLQFGNVRPGPNPGIPHSSVLLCGTLGYPVFGTLSWIIGH